MGYIVVAVVLVVAVAVVAVVVSLTVIHDQNMESPGHRTGSIKWRSSAGHRFPRIQRSTVYCTGQKFCGICMTRSSCCRVGAL